MPFSRGKSSTGIDDIMNKVTESDILSFYLGIMEIPCLIQSPLRKDNRPSFGLYSPDGKRIFYTDFATHETGGIYDLLGNLWNCSYDEVLKRVIVDIPNIKSGTGTSIQSCRIKTTGRYDSSIDLQCKVREWKPYDIEYWESYGISLKWLKYAEVYPISHKIVVKGDNKYVFTADKYAYAYVEHKEGETTLKIYQPFNKNGFKWSNKHDASTISLWTKIPATGDVVCICSSLKDALCLWANTGIPSLAVQGEGYPVSNTAIEELRKRYKRIYILFDNDNTGLADGENLSKQTGFTNLILPRLSEYGNPKDISDLYKALGDRKKFKEIILNLFKQTN